MNEDVFQCMPVRVRYDEPSRERQETLTDSWFQMKATSQLGTGYAHAAVVCSRPLKHSTLLDICDG
ncbi:hypothetical protein K431DRAFT_288248 [Polychaeton citri CBS 116435]|uniref:Uncharacterized protein n=1 Tax=Polychaeton citri CBS 116435 TaxID=1314669 RepID=A0A9P4Q3T0_9PEZI|nr:hypothetical protein K431DRAFT_288248 [Polychaeton citri CBS 116435]